MSFCPSYFIQVNVRRHKYEHTSVEIICNYLSLDMLKHFKSISFTFMLGNLNWSQTCNCNCKKGSDWLKSEAQDNI